MFLEVLKLLRAQSMSVSKDYLRIRLESHPDYPSFIAIHDTLIELGINAYACEGSKEQLRLQNKPFFAHFNLPGANILFFNNVAVSEKRIKDFDKNWSGYLMFVDKTDKFGNAEHTKHHKNERLTNVFRFTSLVIPVLALVWIIYNCESLSTDLLLISSSLGLYFSWLIAQKESGISNIVSDKLCNLAKHSKCESVLFSKGASVLNWLTWEDIGISFFISSIIFLSELTLSTPSNQTNSIGFYYLISICGILFPIYSLYYQLFIVKQLCILCLGVLLALILNAIISLINIVNVSWSIAIIKPVLVFAIILLFVSGLWQLVKSIYQKNRDYFNKEVKLIKLKRSPSIFNSLRCSWSNETGEVWSKPPDFLPLFFTTQN